MSTFAGMIAALGTTHGKERVIGPMLPVEIGLRVDVVRDLDTDRFGTFTREIPRVGAVKLVLLVDGETGLELTGLDVTMETNFSSASVATIAYARPFASRVSFPSHGLLVIAVPHEKPEPALGMTKGLVDPADLDKAVEQLLQLHGRAWLETDMRAHLNPTRMRSIERADGQGSRGSRRLCRLRPTGGAATRRAFALDGFRLPPLQPMTSICE